MKVKGLSNDLLVFLKIVLIKKNLAKPWNNIESTGIEIYNRLRKRLYIITL